MREDDIIVLINNQKDVELLAKITVLFNCLSVGASSWTTAEGLNQISAISSPKVEWSPQFGGLDKDTQPAHSREESPIQELLEGREGSMQHSSQCMNWQAGRRWNPSMLEVGAV